MVPGAKPAGHPASCSRPLRPSRDNAPQDAQWIHKIKFEDYRLQAHPQTVDPATLYTRSGLDWTKRCTPPMAHALGTYLQSALSSTALVVVKDGRPTSLAARIGQMVVVPLSDIPSKLARPFSTNKTSVRSAYRSFAISYSESRSLQAEGACRVAAIIPHP